MRPLRVCIPGMLVATLISMGSLASGGDVTPKDEAERVMSAGIPFAEKMLAEHGEFYPFGFAMTVDGKVAAVAVHSQGNHPSSQQVIDDLIAVFRSGAASGQYKATAIFFDVRVQHPDSAEKTDAIQVGLEHTSGYCVDVYFPYSRTAKGAVIYGTGFAAKRAGSVFGTCK